MNDLGSSLRCVVRRAHVAILCAAVVGGMGGCPTEEQISDVTGGVSPAAGGASGPGTVTGADAGSLPSATGSLPSAAPGFFEVLTEQDKSVVVHFPPSDANGSSYEIVVPPVHGSLGQLAVNEVGASVEYRPGPGFVGIDELKYVSVRNGARSDTAAVAIGVVPVVRFEVQPLYGAEELRVRLRARVESDALLPPATLRWVVDERDYTGPMASVVERILPVQALHSHQVGALLTLAGMTAAFPVSADGRSSVLDVQVPPVITGSVVDEFGAPAPLLAVRGIGLSQDFSATTDTNGFFELFVSPEWEGRVIVDEPGRISDPEQRTFSVVVINQLSQNFVFKPGRRPVPPPAAPPVTVELDEDQVATIDFSAAAADGSDPEAYEIVSVPPHGALRDLGSGHAISATDLPYVLPQGGVSVEYRPSQDYAGLDSFEYRMRVNEVPSASAAVSLRVRPLNDSPRLNLDNLVYLIGRPNQPTVLQVSALDVDAVSAELRWTADPAPRDGQVTFSPSSSESAQTVEVRFSPAPGFLGEDEFGIRCVDARGAVDQSTINVFYTASTLVARAGADRDVAAFQWVSLSSAGSLAPDGSTFAWRQVSGSAVVLENAGSAMAAFRAPATVTSSAIEFELTVRNGAIVSSDRVRITARYGKQALIYSAHAALERLWSLRTPFVVQNGRTLFGFGSYQSSNPAVPFWGDEAGSACDSALWDFQARDGLAGALTAFLSGYNATQNREYLRRAEALGDALLETQNGLNGGWFQDMAYIDGQWRNVGVWGEWGGRRHVPSALQGAITLDDSTSQSCALALLRLYESSQQQRFLAGAKRFGDLLVAQQNVTHDGVQPYRNGGLPQIMPFERAMLVDVNSNADERNPDGPYMAHKTLNDAVMPHAIIFLSELHRVTGEAPYLAAVRLNVDYLLGRHAAYGYRGWGQQYHWRDDRLCWGRPKEPPSFCPGECEIVNMLLLIRARDTDAARKTRIETSLQRYLDWMRNDVPRPTGDPDKLWRYYNHNTSAAPLNTPIFSRDYRNWYGEQNEDEGEGGQPYRSRFDSAWIDRLMDEGTRIDWLRAQDYVNAAPALPIGVLSTAWQPSFENQDRNGAWPNMYSVNGAQRPGIGTAGTANRVAGLYKRYGEITGVITDADGDGHTDTAEAAAGTDPRDSASHPAP